MNLNLKNFIKLCKHYYVEYKLIGRYYLKWFIFLSLILWGVLYFFGTIDGFNSFFLFKIYYMLYSVCEFLIYIDIFFLVLFAIVYITVHICVFIINVFIFIINIIFFTLTTPHVLITVIFTAVYFSFYAKIDLPFYLKKFSNRFIVPVFKFLYQYVLLVVFEYLKLLIKRIVRFIRTLKIFLSIYDSVLTTLVYAAIKFKIERIADVPPYLEELVQGDRKFLKKLALGRFLATSFFSIESVTAFGEKYEKKLPLDLLYYPYNEIDRDIEEFLKDSADSLYHIAHNIRLTIENDPSADSNYYYVVLKKLEKEHEVLRYERTLVLVNLLRKHIHLLHAEHEKKL